MWSNVIVEISNRIYFHLQDCINKLSSTTYYYYWFCSWELKSLEKRYGVLYIPPGYIRLIVCVNMCRRENENYALEWNHVSSLVEGHWVCLICHTREETANHVVFDQMSFRGGFYFFEITIYFIGQSVHRDRVWSSHETNMCVKQLCSIFYKS
jgi:hypothetical protein